MADFDSHIQLVKNYIEACANVDKYMARAKDSFYKAGEAKRYDSTKLLYRAYVDDCKEYKRLASEQKKMAVSYKREIMQVLEGSNFAEYNSYNDYEF